jgi:DNA-directed RNA polymerase subunit M
MECKRPDCGHAEPKGEDTNITTRKRIDREIVVTEGIEGTLPTTKIICGKCKHNEATWIIRQTRAADEPATRIYQCTKCKHKWREY